MGSNFVAFFRQQWVVDIIHFLALLPWVVGPGIWAYQALSVSDDAVAFGRPICEGYEFIPRDGVSVNSIRLVGADIFAMEAVRDAQIHFRDVPYIADWGLYSEALSLEARETYLRELPTGELPGDYVTPPLPTLPPESITTLTALVITPEDRQCYVQDLFLVEVITSTGTVFHTNPSFWTVREMPAVIFEPLLLVAGMYAVLFAVGLIAYRRWRSSSPIRSNV
ncbi:MAG: hypothetical protein OXQ89_07275 [Rhodospirillaceae bacterium]|nr:hypothetical protein [Rhodospirillaceae bacterium]